MSPLHVQKKARVGAGFSPVHYACEDSELGGLGRREEPSLVEAPDG